MIFMPNKHKLSAVTHNVMGGTSLAGKATRFLSIRRQDQYADHHLDQPNSNSDDVEFQFLEQMLLGQSDSSNDHHQILDLEDEENEDEEEEEDPIRTTEKNRSFWDNQNQLLQANICRTSSLESKIRNATKEAIEEIQSGAEINNSVCGCCSNRGTACRNCFMREVCKRLQKAGFNTAICKTKWRTSILDHIPSGEHTFLDVIDNTSSKKGEVRVMIELNFRAEFEMGRGNEEYNRLVKRLPEVYVGKVERLSSIIKILCMAAKKCMKERKMHMGPWRKHRYMQAKWLGPCERNTSTTTTLLMSMGYNNNNSEKIIVKTKPKASLLTVDLLEKLPNMHCTPVEVV